jgi:hypothetical protein
MGGVAVYTRLNGVILWLGDFMLYDSDDLLSLMRELPCKLRGSRQSIPFQKIPRYNHHVLHIFFTYFGLLKLGQGQEMEAYNSETI